MPICLSLRYSHFLLLSIMIKVKIISDKKGIWSKWKYLPNFYNNAFHRFIRVSFQITYQPKIFQMWKVEHGFPNFNNISFIKSEHYVRNQDQGKDLKNIASWHIQSYS